MAVLDGNKSVVKVTERLVRGLNVGLTASNLSSATFVTTAAGASVPIMGMFVLTASVSGIAAQGAVSAAVQEFTITAAGDEPAIEVGDLFIPIAPPVGTGANQLPGGLSILPAKAVTKHKLPIYLSNGSAGTLTPNTAGTFTFLWLKTVATSGT